MNSSDNAALSQKGSYRTVPMQVLSLGFARTGTASMQAALEILGYKRTAHGFDVVDQDDSKNILWQQLIDAKFEKAENATASRLIDRKYFDQLLGDCRAVTDLPSVLFAEDLIAAYPDAKAVLVEREIDSWEKSIAIVNHGVFSWLTYFIELIVDPLVGTHRTRLVRSIWKNVMRGNNASESNANARTVYREHYAHVRRVVPPDRLLDFDLKDGWQPLCEYLDLPVPNEPFPRVNEADALKARIKRIQADSLVAGLKAIMLKLILPGALAAAVVAYALRT